MRAADVTPPGARCLSCGRLLPKHRRKCVNAVSNRRARPGYYYATQVMDVDRYTAAVPAADLDVRRAAAGALTARPPPPVPTPAKPPSGVGSAAVSRPPNGGRRAHASHGSWMPATPAARRAPAPARRPLLPTRAFITLLVTLVLLIAAALAAGRHP